MTSGIVARVMVVAVVIGLMTVGSADACGNHGNPYCPTPTPKITPTATSTPKVTATPKVTPTQPPGGGGFVPPPEDDPKPTPTRTPTAAPSATPTRTPIAVPTPVNGGPTPLINQPVPPTIPAVILPPKAGTGFLAIPSNGQIAPFVVIGLAALLVLGFMHGGARDE